MAIDFSQVKTITIPEGSVKQITDSQGNILWKEYVPQWHTVWSGSISKTVSTDAGSDIDIWTNNVSGTATFRFTFTMSASGGASGSINIYQYSSKITDIEPSSPIQKKITYDATTRIAIVGIERYKPRGSLRYGSGVNLEYSGTTHKFCLSGGSDFNGYNGTATLTVTKIEQDLGQ